MRVWFITGCSSGLGRALATRVLQHGQRAVVTARAAAAIMTVVDPPAPPLNLLLGRVGLELARAKLAGLASNMAQWEAITLGADFPQP